MPSSVRMQWQHERLRNGRAASNVIGNDCAWMCAHVGAGLSAHM